MVFCLEVDESLAISGLVLAKVFMAHGFDQHPEATSSLIMTKYCELMHISGPS